MKKPELLAPAGSADSFHAAINAGADAVYLGLSVFNARMRAKNFTARDLSALLPYARSHNVKIYVTLNTLIKQSEIKPALNVLYQLDRLGVDAVIVADIGLMKLASVHFPSLRLHGSTQAAAHNANGAEFLKSLGAKRIVLARELSMDEILETTKKTSIETEVFIHGALCYSISGLCLASSFIGGASGNRGKCTQPCRRRFKQGGGEGYYFSPYDLQTINVVDKLIGSGVSSFKIEGRMKSAGYVSAVVGAYRRAIDFFMDTEKASHSPDRFIDELRDELRFDFGREKTSFFVDGRKGDLPIDPLRPAGTGILIGAVVEHGGASKLVIDSVAGTGLTINKNDRVRIQPQNGFEGTACKVIDCKIIAGKIEITLSLPIQCDVGDYVFLIGKSIDKPKYIDIDVSSSAKTIKVNFPNAAKIANEMTPPPAVNAKIPKPILWFKADNMEWLNILNASPCQHLIFDADAAEIENLLDDSDTIKTWRSRISIALPPFIEEPKIKFWRGIVEKCLSAGLFSFTISNIGHFPLVNGARHVTADGFLWCLNRFTQRELASRGIGKFVYSYEDEYLNIRDAASFAGIAPIYGKPPLFISRMPTIAGRDTIITDPHGNKFSVAIKNGLYYTLPQSPLCLFARREKLLNCGIEKFLIDLCFHNPSWETVNNLVSSFRDGKKIEGSTIFNFKAGLR
ncbi:MAG: U32 family peptidase [Chitinispirillales bacterium]|nr:U32 family peptidase [Chitinispirillales bacterium]